MAQSTYKSISNAAFVLSSSADMVINKPSGVVDGDLLIAIVVISDGAANRTISPPAGWTSLRNDSINGGTNRVETYYKIASSEGSSYNFTKSGSVDAIAGAIIRIDTHDPSSPIATSNGAGTAGANTNSMSFADTVTPDLANELILFIVFAQATGHSNLTDISGYAVTTSNPSWTEILDILGNPSSPSGTYNFGIAYANRTQTTATGDSSANSNGGIGANRYMSQKIVVRNLTTYSVNVQDTLNVSDSVAINVQYNATVTDQVNLSDDVNVTTERKWTKTQKTSPHIWNNTDKT